MKILICDDKERNAEKNASKLTNSGCTVESLHSTKLKSALTNFLKRVSGLLDLNDSAGNGFVSSEFDEVDVLIVDNNLTDLQMGGARLTAETIIGYLRAFSDVPYIISLNKNPHVDFDLRFLFGDNQSLADLALNDSHLINRRLWGENSEGDFAPWYWPRIADASTRRRKQVEFIAENFDRPVWEALGFPPEADNYLSLRAKSRFQSSGGDLREASFERFFESSRALPPAEINTLMKLTRKQSEFARQAVYQVSAFEIDRWLRRDILGTQDVLIDLPHLLAQMPFLLRENANRLDRWNKVLTSHGPPYGLDERLFEEHLIPARFELDMWVPGPCFWWPILKSSDALTKRFFDDEGKWSDAVFCEDISHFVCVSQEENPPLEIEVEIEGSWIRRHIAFVQERSYSPQSRIIGSAS